MGLIQPVDPQKAEGQIKEAFEFFEQTIGTIPTPMALSSASPGIFNIQLQSLQYFMNHPTLGFPLLSTIRYLVSKEYNYQFCTSFNKELLKKQGLSDEDIETLTQDPENAPLEDKDRAMLAFVVKAIKDPDTVSQTDMDNLHEMGWTDSDALDAMSHAGSMIASSVIMKTFKMDIAC